MTVMNLDQLEVWRLARGFAITIYTKIVPLLPASEKYNLADQLKRAASSVPANIAEGHGRFYFQDNVRFCYIARGSLTEAQSHLCLAKELGFINNEIYTSTTREAESVARSIGGWISYLKKAKTGINEPGANHVVHEIQAPYLIEDSTEQD
ncbi:MAG: four helix bundle protein [Chloroflexi bacterium]|nr:four helix bundle protein [Chloroflexota bacterium]